MTHTIKLVSISVPQVEEKKLSPEEFIAYTARVSNPSNQLNVETAPKLIKYLLDNAHLSPFEMVDFVVEITTSRAIAQQILRHKSASFQEFCLSGDSNIYFDAPRSLRERSRPALHKRKIKDLYNNWIKNDFEKNRIKKMFVRIFDEETKKITHSHIKDVFSTGKKDVYEVTLTGGYKIKCTKEHKFLDENYNFTSLEDIVGELKILTNNSVAFSKKASVACNGIPCYQNKEWMIEAKKRSLTKGEIKGIKYIATEAGCSYHTIRKWLKKHNLSFTRNETASIYDIWNKGKTGYKLPPYTEERREKCRKSARRGADSNLWRGGVDRSERLKITDYVAKYRDKFLKENNYQCSRCSSSKNLELHHIIPVYKDITKAYDLTNIAVLCESCHDEEHKLRGDNKEWVDNKKPQEKNSIKFCKIERIDYIGKEDTFDLEIEHSSHNYIAEGVVVHNSQRYSKTLEFLTYPARRQDMKNRQNSIDDLSQDTKDWFEAAQKEVGELAFKKYEEALERGVAKEQARFLLPLNTKTTIYMKMNVRDWIFYLKLRSGNGTQKEHMDIANSIIKKVMIPNFPVISGVMGWN